MKCSVAALAECYAGGGRAEAQGRGRMVPMFALAMGDGDTTVIDGGGRRVG